MCHSGETAPLGLRLDSLEHALQGSENGPVLVAGDPEASELIKRLKGLSQPRMPLTGPPFLDQAQIAMIEEWIEAGMPAGETAATETEPEPTRTGPGSRLRLPTSSRSSSSAAPSATRTTAS